MAKKHDHVYGPVVEETTDDDGKKDVRKWQACRICGKAKPSK